MCSRVIMISFNFSLHLVISSSPVLWYQENLPHILWTLRFALIISYCCHTDGKIVHTNISLLNLLSKEFWKYCADVKRVFREPCVTRDSDKRRSDSVVFTRGWMITPLVHHCEATRWLKKTVFVRGFLSWIKTSRGHSYIIRLQTFFILIITYL